MAYVYDSASQTDNGYYLFKFTDNTESGAAEEIVIAVRKPVYTGLTPAQRVAAYTALRGQIQLELLKGIAGGSEVNANAATQSLTAANAVTAGTDDDTGTEADDIYDTVTGEDTGTDTSATWPPLENTIGT